MSATSNARDKEKVLDALNGRVAELAGTREPPKRQASENRLYALLIGVDKYASDNIRNLSGATRDAERLRAFLSEQDPPVVDRRIKVLKDEEATAARIVESMHELCGEQEILNGDPILIYYAGHGSNLPKPDGWPTADARIQCLTPHDARIVGDHVEEVVLDITFGAILKRLADKKGHNITVILDCCHSGSATRDDDRGIPRGVVFKAEDGKMDLTVSATYQKEVWGKDFVPRVQCILPEFVNAGLQSHVVLAACASDESAYEDRHTSEGRFTSAFLRAVKVAGTDTMTYSDLMKRLEILPSQTPQCEGRDKDTRILFDKGIVQRHRPCYNVERSGTSYTLHAGEINGVSTGATFSLYENQNAFTSGGSSFGDLVVDKAGPILSSLSPKGDSAISWPEAASNAVAVMTRVGTHAQSAFRVHVDTAKYPELRPAIDALVQEVLHPANSDSSWVSLTLSSRDTAHLSLEPKDDGVGFEILDQRIRGLGLERLNGTVASDQTSLRSALRSAAHFFYHLRSSPSKQGLHRSVEHHLLVLRKEKKVKSDKPILVYEPTGQSIDIKARDAFYPEMPRGSGRDTQREFYGIDIRNTAPKGHGLDLFVWMFYFDCSTLEIARLYEPYTSNAVKPPLPAGMDQPLPLNFGDAGGRPLTFALPENQTTDVGFIRIFLSTRNANLSGIAQKPVVRGALTGQTGCRWTTEPELWDVITIPVVMK